MEAVQGKKDSSTTLIKPEVKINPDTEWNNQSQKWAELFAPELGMTKEEYISSLPKFNPCPEGTKGRFIENQLIPIIVETRIPLSRLLEITGIFIDRNPQEMKKLDEQFETSDPPYPIWVAPHLQRDSLKEDERDAILREDVFVYLRNPEVLKYGRISSRGGPKLNPKHSFVSIESPWKAMPSGDKPFVSNLQPWGIDNPDSRMGTVVVRI